MKMDGGQSPALLEYHPEPDVRYAVQLVGVLLVNIRTGETLSLEYPAAAVWELMTRDLPFDRIVSLLCDIAFVTHPHACSLVEETLEQLYYRGFVVRRNSDG